MDWTIPALLESLQVHMDPATERSLWSLRPRRVNRILKLTDGCTASPGCTSYLLGPLRTALKLSIKLPCQRDVKCVDARDGPPADSSALAHISRLIIV